MNTNLMKSIFLVVAVFMSLSVCGQGITVKKVAETADITASKYERQDSNGKSCAVIKVEVPSLEGLSFDGSVGDTRHSSGVYYVYTSPGIIKLPVFNKKEKVCEIDFSAHGIKIESKHTYVVELAIEQVREMIFKITPANASLTVDGKTVALNEEGIGRFSCEVGATYDYTLIADGYKQMDGEFTYSDEEGGHEPLNILMERKTVPVTFRCNVDKFDVIVDGESYNIKNNGVVYIPVGNPTIRIVASEYEEWVQNATIQDTDACTIDVNLKKSSSVSDKLRGRWGFAVSGGLAIPFGTDKYDIDNALGYPIRVGGEYEHFFKRWFTLRTGIEFFYYAGNDMKVDDKHPYVIDIPFIFNINVPLGKLNRNFFTVGLGPMFGMGSLMKSGDDDSSADTEDTKEKFFAGGRVEARLIVQHFMIGATIDYHYCKDILMGDGVILPMVTLGYRF